jgi:uncharacterized protein
MHCEDAIQVEEVDGLVAGLLVCPEVIKPGEWLPKIWNGADGNEPALDGLEQVNQVLVPLTEQQNTVAWKLTGPRERYAPSLPVDYVTDVIIRECWN